MYINIVRGQPRRLRHIGKNKYQYNSRLIIEKHLGRKLSANEVVHHIDRNTLNDNIENLLLQDKRQHIVDHQKNGGFRRKFKDQDTNWCCSCQQFLPKEQFSRNRNRWNGLSHYCRKCDHEHYQKHQNSSPPSITSKGGE